MLVGLLCMVPAVHAQDAGAAEHGFAERSEAHDGLVDEDEQFARPQSYAFNPLQAREELKVGRYYAKKGSLRAAAGRYQEATRWDANFAEAYWRLGKTLEKLERHEEAMEAYASYLRVEPSGKYARTVRRSLDQLRQSQDRLPLSAERSPTR